MKKDAFRILKKVYSAWKKDDVSMLSAALSYYSVFSLSPLLIIVVVIGSIIFSIETVSNTIAKEVGRIIGTSGAELVTSLLENAERPAVRTFSSIASTIILIIGATGVFTHLQASLNKIWEAKPKPGVIKTLQKRLLSFAIILVIGFLLLISLVLNAVLSALQGYFSTIIPSWTVILMIGNFVFSLLIAFALFMMIYKVLPDCEVSLHNSVIGAGIATVLFTILRFLFSAYVSAASPASVYGAAGSVIVILLWVYLTTQILFIGAEFVKVSDRGS